MILKRGFYYQNIYRLSSFCNGNFTKKEALFPEPLSDKCGFLFRRIIYSAAAQRPLRAFPSNVTSRSVILE